MTVVYLDGGGRTVGPGQLHAVLPWDLPETEPVALDTETSGLFVDGDVEKGPPARVSAVSLAWRHDSCLRTFAVPFDQGRVFGKPGRWSAAHEAWLPLAPLGSLKKPCTECQGTGYAEETTACTRCFLSAAQESAVNATHDDWVALVGWLTGRRLVGHHAKFDAHIVRAGLRETLRCGDPVCPCNGAEVSRLFVWDTLLAQGLIDPLESTSLKPTAKRLWGDQEAEEAVAVKAALKKNGVGLTHRYDLLDWDVLGPYAAKDAELTLRLFERQQALIDEGAVDAVKASLIEREVALSDVLYKMERRGVALDRDGMLAEAQKIDAAIEDAQSALPFAPANLTGAKEWFFGTSGLELIPVKRTDAGAVCLDVEVVRRLVEDGASGAAEWDTLVHLQSLRAKWYKRWPYLTGPDGRIRTSFRQMRMESDRVGGTAGGAISGRLSVSRVQLMAVPHEYRIPKGVRGVREFLTAEPGHARIQFDLSQGEVRIATWAARAESMAATLAMGTDVHGATATTIFGVKPDDDDWDEMRAVAKRLTFAMLYGAGVNTTRAQIITHTGVDYGESRTRDFVTQYRAKYPEFTRASKAAQHKADRGFGGCGFVRLVNGRERRFGWREHTYKAFNAVIQGGLAEVMKVWMLEVEEERPGCLVNQVHDSLELETPQSGAAEVSSQVSALGCRIFEHYFSTDAIPIRFVVDEKELARG